MSDKLSPVNEQIMDAPSGVSLRSQLAFRPTAATIADSRKNCCCVSNRSLAIVIAGCAKAYKSTSPKRGSLAYDLQTGPGAHSRCDSSLVVTQGLFSI